MIRSASVLTLALALGFAAFAAPRAADAMHHEPVINAVTVNVEPGKLDKYRSEVKKLAAVQQRLGVTARVRMWRLTQGGPDTGAVMVGLEFPNVEAWARDMTKLQADSEWQKIIRGLDDLRTVASSGLWRDISPNPVQAPAGGPGSVLLVTGVAVKPGKLEDYRRRVGTFEAVSKRLGLSGQPRMWHAEVNGPNTGGVAVGVEYPSLETYAREQGKLAGDAEWKRLLQGLDAIRTLNGRWLYLEITP